VSDSTFSFDRQWPYRPDFNQFKRQAKELLKAYRAGDANAVAEVQRHEQAPDPTAFALHDAQRVLARSYGFTSWQKLNRRNFTSPATETTRIASVSSSRAIRRS
jgi:hypothetical protein